MTENEQKQQFSVAYVHAVAARAGFACERPHVDDDSVDVTIGARGLIHASAQLRSPRIEVQLKATAQERLTDDALTFPLPVKNYNDLRERTAIPRILVVLRLPAEIDGWLAQTEEQMITKHAAYWVSLLGTQSTTNKSTVTVPLPRSQLFTVQSLHGLMQRAARKEPL